MNALMAKLFRFTLTITGFSVATAFLLIAAVPHLGKPGTVTAAVAAALFVAMYDFGLFHCDLEI